MSTDQDVKFVAKLVQWTKEGRLQWTATSPPRDDASGSAFETAVESKRLRVYRYLDDAMNPEYWEWKMGRTGMGGMWFGSREDAPPSTIRTERTCLEVISSGGTAVYRFPNITGLADLFDSAAYAAADVDGLISAVLSKA